MTVSSLKHAIITREIFKSPVRLVFTILIFILLFELGIMYLLRSFPHYSRFMMELLDGLLLVISLTPVLYFLVFRPMIRYAAESNRLQRELGQSLSLLSATLESTADGILVVDKEGKVAHFNRRFVELWQIPYEILITRNDQILLHFVLDQLVDPESFVAKVEELYSNDDEISTDLVEFKDGRVFERYSQSQIFERKSVGRVFSFHDITERVQYEKIMRENEARLHALNATKDKFFSIIAHDLKGPFTSIMGYSELMAYRVKKQEYSKIEEFSIVIREATSRVMALLTNLLDWSRTQTGKIAFSPEKIEIPALLDDILSLFQEQAKLKTVEIQTEIPADLTVFADKEMIGTILRNLISNALKFSNPGGQVVISSVMNERHWIFSVRDQGIGIQEEVLKTLFSIEENYSTPGTNHEAGTGLGLILCKEFVEKHGGTIWAESKWGQGSKFYFTLPMI